MFSHIASAVRPHHHELPRPSLDRPPRGTNDIDTKEHRQTMAAEERPWRVLPSSTAAGSPTRAPWSRQRAASPTQTKPLTAPTTTSLRWCMPRYKHASPHLLLINSRVGQHRPGNCIEVCEGRPTLPVSAPSGPPRTLKRAEDGCTGGGPASSLAKRSGTLKVGRSVDVQGVTSAEGFLEVPAGDDP
jgi:hypothetical protein